MPEYPESRRYRIKANITLYAPSRSEAQQCAGIAVEAWSDETGWKHLHGAGVPEGYVIVEELVLGPENPDHPLFPESEEHAPDA